MGRTRRGRGAATRRAVRNKSDSGAVANSSLSVAAEKPNTFLQPGSWPGAEDAWRQGQTAALESLMQLAQDSDEVRQFIIEHPVVREAMGHGLGQPNFAANRANNAAAVLLAQAAEAELAAVEAIAVAASAIGLHYDYRFGNMAGPEAGARAQLHDVMCDPVEAYAGDAGATREAAEGCDLPAEGYDLPAEGYDLLAEVECQDVVGKEGVVFELSDIPRYKTRADLRQEIRDAGLCEGADVGFLCVPGCASGSAESWRPNCGRALVHCLHPAAAWLLKSHFQARSELTDERHFKCKLAPCNAEFYLEQFAGDTERFQRTDMPVPSANQRSRELALLATLMRGDDDDDSGPESRNIADAFSDVSDLPKGDVTQSLTQRLLAQTMQ